MLELILKQCLRERKENFLKQFLFFRTVKKKLYYKNKKKNYFDDSFGDFKFILFQTNFLCGLKIHNL